MIMVNRHKLILLFCKNELNNAVLNCIIKDGLSFSVFSKPGMKEYLSKAVPGYTPPHRVTIAKHIGGSYKHYRNQLKKYFVFRYWSHINIMVKRIFK